MADSEEYEENLLVNVESFPELLKWFRRRAGLTQAQLAEKLEVRRATITEWETSKFAPKYRDHMKKLATIFVLSPVETNQLLQAAQFPEVPPPPTFEPDNPYKGLAAFTQADRYAFFGREQLIKDLLQFVQQMTITTDQTKRRLLAAIGPSGSGKTSVMLAGLLPELQQGAIAGSQEWIYIEPFRPGREPTSSLAEALSSALKREPEAIRQDLEASGQGLHLLIESLTQSQKGLVVLPIDQLEELFSPDVEETIRQHFIRLLVTACEEPESCLLLILVIRADCYGSLSAYPELARLVTEGQQLILPLDQQREALRTIIEKPANLPKVKLTFEKNLVDEILLDLHRQVGVLPLLQFTLDQLFQHRDGHTLTLQAYAEIGRARGALAQYVENLYLHLPSQEHQQLARFLFLRLLQSETTSGESLLITRRQAALEEFVLPDPPKTQVLREVITIFVGHRLLVTNRSGDISTLEVSHEALLQEWPRMGIWLEEAGNTLQLQQALTRAAREWEQSSKSGERLYRGTQLRAAQQWAKQAVINVQERTFLQASARRYMQSVLIVILVMLIILSTTGVAGWGIVQHPDPTVVTTLQDNVNGSLRYCIDNAPSGSIIAFDSSLKGIIKLTGTVEVGKKQLTLVGPEADQLAISGGTINANIHVPSGAILHIDNLSFKNTQTRVNAFLFNEGTLTFTHSVISNNKTAGQVAAYGGGIFNRGTLTLTDSMISNNSTSGDLYQSTGGGIENEGTLTVMNSTFSNNTASSSSQGGFGGGINNFKTGTLIVMNSIFSGNSARGKQGSRGGAISNGGKLMVTGSTFTNNVASDNDLSGFSGGNAANAQQQSSGGGIENQGQLTVTGSTFSNNSASGKQQSSGGGIDNEGQLTVVKSTFSNNSARSSDQYGLGGGIENASTSTLMVTNSSFSGNSANGKQTGQGGGIDNGGTLTMVGSTFSNNSASSSDQYGNGGGIENGGIVSLANSTLSDNLASGKLFGDGGGIANAGQFTAIQSTFTNNTAQSFDHYGTGGAILNEGTLSLASSTFSGNSAIGKQQGDGGGINNAGKLTVVKSTFWKNTASDSNGLPSFGGGMANFNMVVVDASTFSDNSAIGDKNSQGGGIDNVKTLTLTNSIIAANNAPEGPDLYGNLASGGYNLLTNAAGASGLSSTDKQATLDDLKLDSVLVNNGGATQTLKLLPGSVAIDIVPLQACHIPVTDPVSGHKMVMTTDQRGDARPDGSEQFCDIGAYEYQD